MFALAVTQNTVSICKPAHTEGAKRCAPHLGKQQGRRDRADAHDTLNAELETVNDVETSHAVFVVHAAILGERRHAHRARQLADTATSAAHTVHIRTEDVVPQAGHLLTTYILAYLLIYSLLLLYLTNHES